MYYYIRGKLVLLEPSMAVIDAAGVGYQLTISQTTFATLQQNRTEEVRLLTHYAVREDGVELFGFATDMELSSFRMLISVSGVGPKAAMAVLSLLSPERFAMAVCTEDRKTIAQANGVGPKTAARIVLELKDKLMKENPSQLTGLSQTGSTGAAPVHNSKLRDAQDTLKVLGFTQSEILNALKDIDSDKMELQDIVKAAMKKMRG
ncbi:MAG: Holliday junction branch migration protein RuvA [Clostridia bacterium]|nr:Holliday junction branch migration protein RuvA [Clostridia bacterium]